MGESSDPPTGITLRFYVDDVDAATDAVRVSGLVVAEEPADKPWGESVSLVTDRFGTGAGFDTSIG